MILLWVSLLQAAGVCPGWSYGQGIPSCPKSGATVISGHHPSLAFTLTGPARNLVLEILRSSDPKTPAITVAMNQKGFTALRARVRREALKLKDHSRLQRWTQALVRAEPQRRPWQGRSFGLTWSEKGNPQFRSLPQTSSELRGLFRIANHSCDRLQKGAVLDLPSANMVRGLPGGLCVRSEEAPSGICGDASSEIVVDTSWMRDPNVGSLIAVTRDHLKASPCDFGFLVASPSKAMALLKTQQSMDFVQASSSLSDQPTWALHRLCRSLLSYRKQDVSLCNEGFKGFKNGEVRTILEKDWTFQVAQAHVGRLASGLREDISSRLRQVLPQCNPRFIEVPMLFAGGTPIKSQEAKPEEGLVAQYSMPKGLGVSLLPNTLDSQWVGSDLYVARPENELFQAYLSKTIQRQFKLRPRYYDITESVFRKTGEGLTTLMRGWPSCRREEAQ